VVGASAALIAVQRGPSSAIGAVLLAAAVLGLAGLTTISPGQGRVVQVFGRYRVGAQDRPAPGQPLLPTPYT
jgi:regulator of protease activity HflC (stomatin/prohibitin superfamily)